MLGIFVIGELINASIKTTREIIENRDVAALQDLARRQVEGGADFLDINVAAGSGNSTREAEDMKWAVRVVWEAAQRPLVIDTADQVVLGAGLGAYREIAGNDSVPMINSVTAESDRLRPFLELAAEYEALVIALPIDEKGIPPTASGRMEICRKIVGFAGEFGVDSQKLYFDPLVLPVSVDSSNAATTLETLKGITEMQGVKSTMGLSNISFGLPHRALLNRVFLAMALQVGLDSVILNPLDSELMATVRAGEVLCGKDEMCQKYLKAYRKGKLGRKGRG